MHYKIGTRPSKLARIQAEMVQGRLAAAYPDDTFEIVLLSSRGDRETARPLTALGAGAFVYDLEERLRNKEVDLLVHSMKDLPANEPEGLVLARSWTRADPRDALVSRHGLRLDDLPQGATVATGSVRRTLFLKAKRPDFNFVTIRGNVDTRLRKLFAPKPDEPQLDALVLACAGLDRLGRADVITERLDPSWMIPAPNQGQLAIELRAEDTALKAKVDALGDATSDKIAKAERDFLRATGATCRDAVAAYAQFVNGKIVLNTFFEASGCGPLGDRPLPPTPESPTGVAVGLVGGDHRAPRPPRDTRPVRKQLDHRGPLSIDVTAAWYFITLCAEGHRAWTTIDGHTFDEIAKSILDEGRFYHNSGKWFLSLMLVMPDHIHLIVHGPPGGRPLPDVIGDFKRYLTSQCGLAFQRDFFDTRIRDDEHYAEKFRYICNNPVRKELCATARDWPYVIAFDRSNGQELEHR